jgi:hypothetical protein
MTRREYVNSILTELQVIDIDYAISHKQSILIKGDCGSANGKTTLANFLRKCGADVYEPDDMLVINMDKPLENIVQNVLDSIED